MEPEWINSSSAFGSHYCIAIYSVFVVRNVFYPGTASLRLLQGLLWVILNDVSMVGTHETLPGETALVCAIGYTIDHGIIGDAGRERSTALALLPPNLQDQRGQLVYPFAEALAGS
ncbi:hypothetical protein Y032_0540g3164 [Ancylostoma ceylanicum]|uniref:Uncharacterized protein n=1 Tax=Ancylostoma ceylanicum TaxID=53326 RepID=A0A016WRG5_9BILA|nr:hypothetical protein Y032_0540g3164 [Ancylostoma ceylanicum]